MTERLPDRTLQAVSHFETQPAESARVSVTHGADVTQLATVGLGATFVFPDGSPCSQGAGGQPTLRMSPAEAVTILSRLIDQDVDVRFQIYSPDSRANDVGAPPSGSVERRRARQARYRKRLAERSSATPRATQNYASATSPASPSPLDPQIRNNLSDLGINQGNPEEEPTGAPGARGSNGTLFGEKATPQATLGYAKSDAQATPKRRQRRGELWHFVPADWAGPNSSHREAAARLRLNVDEQAEGFRLHEFKDPKSNADLAFHRWLRTARELLDKGGRGGAPDRNGKSVIDGLMADAMRLRAEGR